MLGDARMSEVKYIKLIIPGTSSSIKKEESSFLGGTRSVNFRENEDNYKWQALNLLGEIFSRGAIQDIIYQIC